MIQVRRVYTPKPGRGELANHLKDLQGATIEGGFPPLSVYRRVFGPHGTMVTQQEWSSIADYEASRAEVRRTAAITEIFDRIYPLLASTHVTEVYEEAG
ncbi:MAG: hypothetical protein O3A47_12625 [Chloroflexi bacterium]|nr:hypothetical protein [Chloroflexota bacterium]